MNAAAIDGCTPLHAAALTGCEGLTRILIDAGEHSTFTKICSPLETISVAQVEYAW